MRQRLVVIAIFATAMVVTAFIAFASGVLPRAERARADVQGAVGLDRTIADLGWPDKALGLAAAGSRVAWEVPSGGKDVAGIWTYDVRTGEITRLLPRSSVGAALGRLRMGGSIIAWSAWQRRRGQGPAGIEAFDSASGRRWTVARQGLSAVVSRTTVVWAERRAGATRLDDAIRASNQLTDEEFFVPADGRVHDLAASDGWAAWVSGRGRGRSVWAASLTYSPTTYRLARTGTAVAMDRGRIIWGAQTRGRSSVIILWNRRSRHSEELCRVRGTVHDIALSRRFAAWLTTRRGHSRVWIYDFKQDRAFPLTVGESEQASPVLLRGRVLWADRRSGRWELYERILID